MSFLILQHNSAGFNKNYFAASRDGSFCGYGKTDFPRIPCGKCIAKRDLFALKSFSDAAAGFVEIFRQNAGFGEGGHEVGIAGPARQGVEMKVSGDTGTGGLAQVHAEIDAVRAIELGEDAFHALGKIGHLVRRGRGQGRKARFMRVRNDHDVAGGVGKCVEADKAGVAAVDDVRCGVGSGGVHAGLRGVIGRGDEIAEDAAVIAGPGSKRGRHALAGIGRVSGDVVVAPGCPEIVHGGQYKDAARQSGRGSVSLCETTARMRQIRPPRICAPIMRQSAPCAVQIAGRSSADSLTLRAAHCYHKHVSVRTDFSVWMKLLLDRWNLARRGSDIAVGKSFVTVRKSFLVSIRNGRLRPEEQQDSRNASSFTEQPRGVSGL